MKTILLICAFAALAAAAPSDDVETDLLTTTNDIVPETNFAEEEAAMMDEAAMAVEAATAEMEGRDARCMSKLYKHPNAVAKHKHNMRVKKHNEKMADEYGPKSAATLKSQPTLKYPLCSKLTRHQMMWKKVKMCGKVVTYAGVIPCRCKGRKVPSYLKSPKSTWNKDHNKSAKFQGGPGTSKCYMNSKKISPSENKECPDDGRTTNDKCSPLPEIKKTCQCLVGVGRRRPSVHLKTTTKHKYFDWADDHKGWFRNIVCSGCSAVTIHDDDLPGGRHHVELGKNKSCCGKKQCHYKITGSCLFHDLCDDAKKIRLGRAC